MRQQGKVLERVKNQKYQLKKRIYKWSDIRQHRWEKTKIKVRIKKKRGNLVKVQK